MIEKSINIYEKYYNFKKCVGMHATGNEYNDVINFLLGMEYVSNTPFLDNFKD